MKNENEPKIYCRYTELRDIATLIENPKNPNTHPEYQLERLAEIIKWNGWRQPVTISDRSGLIVKGHGRYRAAKLAGLTKIPVEVQHYENEAAELADLLADNRIAELAELDMGQAKTVVDEMIDAGAPIEMSGFSVEDFEEALEDTEDALSESRYSQIHEGIIYEPRGEQPSISELVDHKKQAELLADIEAAEGITDEERAFLREAANRHNVFAYDKIAEYYAHATPDMQHLMEESALVIIDLDSAIELGYVRLRKELLDIREADGVKTADDDA